MTLAACRKCGKPFPTHTPNCPDRVLPPASLQTIAGEEGVGFSRQPSREKEAEAKIMKWKKRLTYVVVIAVGAGFITYLSEGWGTIENWLASSRVRVALSWSPWLAP